MNLLVLLALSYAFPAAVREALNVLGLVVAGVASLWIAFSLVALLMSGLARQAGRTLAALIVLVGVVFSCLLAFVSVAFAAQVGPYERLNIVMSVCRTADDACQEIARPWPGEGQCYGDKVGGEMDRWRARLPKGYSLSFVECRIARRGA